MLVGIVGAGPAGSVLARELGPSAILFDHSHPREKPCGGGLTPKVYNYLDIPDKLVLARMNRAEIIYGKHKHTIKIPEILSVDRQAFDYWLLKEAVSSGAEFIPERVVGVHKRDTTWIIQTDKGEYTVDFLVGADGAGSLVRHSLIGPHEDVAVAMESSWRYNSDAMQLFFYPNLVGYAWAFPKAGYTNVGIGALAGNANVSKLEELVTTQFPGLSRDKLLRWALPMSSKRSGYNDFALIGDAAGHVNPISGEGISYAIRDALLLARAIKERNPARYEQYWRRSFGWELDNYRYWRPRIFKYLHIAVSRRRFLERAMHMMINGKRLSVAKLALAFLTP